MELCNMEKKFLDAIKIGDLSQAGILLAAIEKEIYEDNLKYEELRRNTLMGTAKFGDAISMEYVWNFFNLNNIYNFYVRDIFKCALENKQIDILRWVINNSKRINFKIDDANLNTAIKISIKQGCLEQIKYLNDIAEEKDIQVLHTNTLFNAVMYGTKECIEYFKEKFKEKLRIERDLKNIRLFKGLSIVCTEEELREEYFCILSWKEKLINKLTGKFNKQFNLNKKYFIQGFFYNAITKSDKGKIDEILGEIDLTRCEKFIISGIGLAIKICNIDMVRYLWEKMNENNIVISKEKILEFLRSSIEDIKDERAGMKIFRFIEQKIGDIQFEDAYISDLIDYVGRNGRVHTFNYIYNLAEKNNIYIVDGYILAAFADALKNNNTEMIDFLWNTKKDILLQRNNIQLMQNFFMPVRNRIQWDENIFEKLNKRGNIEKQIDRFLGNYRTSNSFEVSTILNFIKDKNYFINKKILDDLTETPINKLNYSKARYVMSKRGKYFNEMVDKIVEQDSLNENIDELNIPQKIPAIVLESIYNIRKSQNKKEKDYIKNKILNFNNKNRVFRGDIYGKFYTK